MGDGRPLDRPVPAEGEARLAVDVLRVAGIRAIVALVDGNFNLGSFGMRLPRTWRRRRNGGQAFLAAFSMLAASVGASRSHHIDEVEAGVRELEVFEQTVEPPAVERTPGAVEVVSGLRLLPGVVVVLELEVGREFTPDLTAVNL